MPKYDSRRNKYELRKLKKYRELIENKRNKNSYVQISEILNYYKATQESYYKSQVLCVNLQFSFTNWKFILLLLLISSTVSTQTEVCNLNTCKNDDKHLEDKTSAKQLEATNICLFPWHLRRCNMPSDVNFVVNKEGILQAESCFMYQRQLTTKPIDAKLTELFNKCQEDAKKFNQVLTSGDSECKNFGTIKNQIDEENLKYIDKLKRELSSLGTMGTEPVNIALNNLGFKHKLLLNLEKMILKFRLGNCGELAFLTEARLLINNIKSGTDIRIQNLNLSSRGIHTATGYDQHTFCVIGAPQNIPDKIVSDSVTSVQEYLDELYFSPAFICDPWINQGVLIPFSQVEKVPYGALYGFGPRGNFYNNLKAVSLRNFTPTDGLSSSQAKYVRSGDRDLNDKLIKAVQSFEQQIDEQNSQIAPRQI